LLLSKRAKENIKQDRKENKSMQLHGYPLALKRGWIIPYYKEVAGKFTRLGLQFRS